MANLANHERFAKIFLANIKKVYGICTDCCLFTSKNTVLWLLLTSKIWYSVHHTTPPTANVVSVYILHRWSKLQEINDKHVEVLKAAAEAEGSLDSIQQRKDDLVKQTNWAQPAVLQQHMLIAEVISLVVFVVKLGAWLLRIASV